jgi:hypothetical protein
MIAFSIGAFIDFIMLAMRTILATAKTGFSEMGHANGLILEIIRELGQCLKI